ncbi:hypothetical protein GCM10027345_27290 [Hymenobacter daeguensis]
MHGEVGFAAQQAGFQLFGEDAFGADFGQTAVLHGIAGGLHGHNFGFETGVLQQAGNVFRLPKGEAAGAGGEADYHAEG